MRYLTTYLDDEINFKFGNNGSIIELKAVNDHTVTSFSNEEKLLIRIKNEESYVKTVPVTAERKIIQLPTKLLKDLTVGQYDVELWQGEGDNQIIYPDEGFLRLKIHGNASQIDGSLVSSITLADFENKFNELAQKIEDKLEKLLDIDGKNISIDVKVVDGNLWINGKDTGINLTAKDGRDGRDGHTPEITVSDAGTLIIDGIDTNKSLIGPRGENGLPGKDGVAGQDGKSAYQVAVDNGFDGTEAEWLRSLHGNDGLDGKSGRDGLSAYELAKKDGFRGTEIEWLASLKGKDANPTLVLNTIHDKGFWGDTTIRNSFDPQINIVTTKPLKVGNLTSITIDNVVLPGKAAIGVGTLEGNTYTFAYCKVADLAVGDTTIQLDWPIQNNNYYLFVSGKPFQTRGNGDADAGSRFKYMLADTRNYDTGNRIKVDGESLGSFKYNFVLNYTGKTRIDLEQILKNTMPYANKKITFLGDSITSGGTTSNGKQAFSYVDYLKDYLGAEITNKGLSGSVITEGNVENQTQSFVSRSNQIQGQDFVTIFGGINDFWFNSPLGSMEDSSDNVQSFYGALKFLVENLSKKNPIAHFLFVTPLKECKEGAPHTYEDNNKLVLHKNRAGFTEEDYVNAIKEVAAYYSVPVLDLFNSSNMNPYIESQRQYFADDLHPNQLGAQRLALLISQVINNGVSSGFLRGANGKSAYLLWLDAGNDGTEQDFLNSLKGMQGESGPAGNNGSDGMSAYQIALKNGFSGTEVEWLNSLRGKDGTPGVQGVPGESGKDGQRGERGLSAYEIAKNNGFDGTEQDWLASLRGKDGVQGASGSNGSDGHDGLSAYEIAKKNGFVGTEQEWLDSLKGVRGEPGKSGIDGKTGTPGRDGSNGKSAYEIWLSQGNSGSEQDFINSLRGPKGDSGQIPDVSDIKKTISDATQDISKINVKMSSMFVNILDFGAQPENVNFDSAPAFNKAIQALPSVGGTIFIPNGNYFLKSTVNIDRSYVHVMGLNHGLRSGIDPVDGSTQAGGGGAKVTVQNPITAFKLENTHNSNRLSGITFSGFDLRGDTNAGVGIDGVSNTDRVVIDNMTINNVGIGVRLHAADAPRITNSWIAETQSSILLTGASQQAEIKNNSLGAQPKGTTIYMENPDRFNISGNNIYPDGASAIRILNPVHGSIVGNTISAYYNGMIEFLPNSDGAFGNGNVISSNVIALESWHDNPDGKDNKWGIVHIQAFNNVIAGNNILANGTPTNTTGILVMKGDYNRISSNVITIQDTNSKVVINGAANNNWVIYSTEGSAFQDGGNQSNKNIGI